MQSWILKEILTDMKDIVNGIVGQGKIDDSTHLVQDREPLGWVT